MLVVAKKYIVLIICIIACGIIIGACAGLLCKPAAAATGLPTIVIDAGHGGIDAGVYGVETNVKESEINLAIAKKLQGKFANAGFNCVMTRTTAAGLYGDTSKGFKMRDMQERKRIIEECNADMVISVHQNTCPLPSRRGSHVFYDPSSESGKQLAEYIQRYMNGLSGGVESNTALAGDYFMLKCTTAPSVIVECGFLSNAEDEKLLIDQDYQNEIANAIFKGCIMFLS